MPFLDQIVLASSAVPREGNTWDLIGASWDTLPAESLPVQTGFALLVSLLLSPEEAARDHEVAVGLTAPDGSSAGGMKATVARMGEQQILASADERVRAEMVLVAEGVVFTEHGLYGLSISWDGQPLREPLRIRVVPPEVLA
jgi:hypothetical protein